MPYRNYQTLVARGDRIQERARRRPPARRRRRPRLPHARRRLPHLPQRETGALQDALRSGGPLRLPGGQCLRLRNRPAHTTAGRTFVNRIVSARALGVVQNGEPQFAGSDTGDPGLSSALAEMKADWDVVKGAAWFQQPRCLRHHRLVAHRKLPHSSHHERRYDLEGCSPSEPPRRYARRSGCAPLLPANQPRQRTARAGHRHRVQHHHRQWSQSLRPAARRRRSRFQPKFLCDEDLCGASLWKGIAAWTIRRRLGGKRGGNSPPDPISSFLDPLALARTPYIYLIPVGVDSMRSPPLGDQRDSDLDRGRCGDSIALQYRGVRFANADSISRRFA